MGAQAGAKPAKVIERLYLAMNRHDLGAFLDCFDPNYRSEQPAHPNRGFGGREQVEKNWSALFEGIPDFHAELLATATEGDRHGPNGTGPARGGMRHPSTCGE